MCGGRLTPKYLNMLRGRRMIVFYSKIGAKKNITTMKILNNMKEENRLIINNLKMISISTAILVNLEIFFLLQNVASL